jgi:hypothetical protein
LKSIKSSPFYGMPPDTTPAVPLDANGLLAADLACRKCSYNLRGLSVEGLCPECGRAIGLSVVGDLLRYSDPNWLRTLRRGINLILLDIILVVLLLIASIALTAAGTAFTIRETTGSAIGFAIQGIFFLGGWFLTMPDPSGIGEDLYGTSRKVIRVTLLIGVTQPLVEFVKAAIGPSSVELRLGLDILDMAITLVGAIGHVAQLQYLRKLALRIPDRKLSDRARLVMWGLGISYGVLIVFTFIMTVAMRGTTPAAGMTTAGCINGIAGLGFLIFGVMYLLVLEKFGKYFKQQELFARQKWAAQMPQTPPQPVVPLS